MLWQAHRHPPHKVTDIPRKGCQHLPPKGYGIPVVTEYLILRKKQYFVEIMFTIRNYGHNDQEVQ